MVAPALVALRPLGPPDQTRATTTATSRASSRCSPQPLQATTNGPPLPARDLGVLRRVRVDRRSRTRRRGRSSSASSRPPRRSASRPSSRPATAVVGVRARRARQPAHLLRQAAPGRLAGLLAVGAGGRRHQPDAHRRQHDRLVRRLERHRLPGPVHEDGGRRWRLERVRGAALVAARPVLRELRASAWSPTSPPSRTRAPAIRSSARAASRAAQGSGQSIAFVGGTSAAAPLVAGMIALWNQQARNQGLPRPGLRRAAAHVARAARPAGVPRHHPGHQRPLRRLLLPDPDRLRPGHRLGLADRQRRRVEPPTLTPSPIYSGLRARMMAEPACSWTRWVSVISMSVRPASAR